MTIKWLGQAGLLFDDGQSTVLVDPYLSDACHKKNPKSFRRTPIDESFLRLKPDVIVLTHDHLDHTDGETLSHYLLPDSRVTVLASRNAWERVRAFGGNNNYVMFTRGTVWTHMGICFTAVMACHSDAEAVGVIIDDGSKKYYVAGDTLYNERIFSDIPTDIDTVFVPINGVGNNMNAVDAARFADRVGAKHSVPLHFGMFDEIDPHIFKAENAVIPHPYREIELT